MALNRFVEMVKNLQELGGRSFADWAICEDPNGPVSYSVDVDEEQLRNYVRMVLFEKLGKTIKGNLSDGDKETFDGLFSGLDLKTIKGNLSDKDKVTFDGLFSGLGLTFEWRVALSHLYLAQLGLEHTLPESADVTHLAADTLVEEEIRWKVQGLPSLMDAFASANVVGFYESAKPVLKGLDGMAKAMRGQLPFGEYVERDLGITRTPLVQARAPEAAALIFLEHEAGNLRQELAQELLQFAILEDSLKLGKDSPFVALKNNRTVSKTCGSITSLIEKGKPLHSSDLPFSKQGAKDQGVKYATYAANVTDPEGARSADWDWAKTKGAGLVLEKMQENTRVESNGHSEQINPWLWAFYPAKKGNSGKGRKGRKGLIDGRDRARWKESAGLLAEWITSETPDLLKSANLVKGFGEKLVESEGNGKDCYRRAYNEIVYKWTTEWASSGISDEREFANDESYRDFVIKWITDMLLIALYRTAWPKGENLDCVYSTEPVSKTVEFQESGSSHEDAFEDSGSGYIESDSMLVGVTLSGLGESPLEKAVWCGVEPLRAEGSVFIGRDLSYSLGNNEYASQIFREKIEDGDSVISISPHEHMLSKKGKPLLSRYAAKVDLVSAEARVVLFDKEVKGKAEKGNACPVVCPDGEKLENLEYRLKPGQCISMEKGDVMVHICILPALLSKEEALEEGNREAKLRTKLAELNLDYDDTLSIGENACMASLAESFPSYRYNETLSARENARDAADTERVAENVKQRLQELSELLDRLEKVSRIGRLIDAAEKKRADLQGSINDQSDSLADLQWNEGRVRRDKREVKQELRDFQARCRQLETAEGQDAESIEGLQAEIQGCEEIIRGFEMEEQAIGEDIRVASNQQRTNRSCLRSINAGIRNLRGVLREDTLCRADQIIGDLEGLLAPVPRPEPLVGDDPFANFRAQYDGLIARAEERGSVGTWEGLREEVNEVIGDVKLSLANEMRPAAQD